MSQVVSQRKVAIHCTAEDVCSGFMHTMGTTGPMTEYLDEDTDTWRMHERQYAAARKER
jgi:hypothetical protein